MRFGSQVELLRNYRDVPSRFRTASSYDLEREIGLRFQRGSFILPGRSLKTLVSPICNRVFLPSIGMKLFARCDIRLVLSFHMSSCREGTLVIFSVVAFQATLCTSLPVQYHIPDLSGHPLKCGSV